jgi:Flp pilus assembly protein TadD
MNTVMAVQSKRSMTARLSFWMLLVASAMTAAACATPLEVGAQLGGGRVSADMLLHASPVATGAEPQDLGAVDVLDITPEMKAFLDDNLHERQGEREHLRQLIYAVIVEGSFQLVYDESTRTAGETFRDRRGNCLSFTNMFVAMARYAGLKANYQEVDVPPDWSLTGQSFLLSKHVNVLLELSWGERIVDFNVYDFKITFDKNVISDQRGRAHYFNNLGVEYMLAGSGAQAMAHFRQSLLEDETFTPAWINLGILYRREALPEYAEAAYLKALHTDAWNLVAMSNLANLYTEEGLSEYAALYQARVESHRMENPYYRYLLANEAFTNGDYGSAIGHLEFAIQERPHEDRFLALMSMSYLMIGDRQAAQSWMKKAEAAAGDDSSKQRYQNKLELLLGRDNQP